MSPASTTPPTKPTSRVLDIVEALSRNTPTSRTCASCRSRKRAPSSAPMPTRWRWIKWCAAPGPGARVDAQPAIGGRQHAASARGMAERAEGLNECRSAGVPELPECRSASAEVPECRSADVPVTLVELDAIQRARQRIAPARARDAAGAGVERERVGAPVAQVREPAGGRRLQAARGVQLPQPARSGGPRAAASSPTPRAITGRRWRWPRIGSARRRWS